MGTKSEQVRKALRERYPCAVAPKGAQLAMAVEFGVTRQRISQIMKEMAFSIAPGVNRTHPYVCVCGAPVRSDRRLCLKCRFVELPCAWCGKPKKKSVAALTRQMTTENEKRAARGLPLHTGIVFCDHKCHGSWFGVYHGWGTRPHTSRKGASHCMRGHEFTPENTYVHEKSGHRTCKQCVKERYRARRDEIRIYSAERYRQKKAERRALEIAPEPNAPEMEALERGMQKVRAMIQKAREKS